MSFSDDFNRAWPWVLAAEGGDSDHPADQGGRTRYGISQRQYPDLDMDSLTEEQAKHIYHQNYWLAYRCDRLPWPINLILFDAVVQHRPRTAVRLVQAALGDIKQDGLMGPQTITRATQVPVAQTLDRYFVGRADLYHTIVLANSSQAAFLRGWFGRLFRLQRLICGAGV